MGKAGWLGVKVFPPQDSVISFDQPQNNYLNALYFVYQPVSYTLNSRLGTRKQYREMVKSCRKHNVLINNDIVINHMSGGGNDIINNHCNTNDFWKGKDSITHSPYFTHSMTYGNDKYTAKLNAPQFPGAAYGPSHFHCDKACDSWADGNILNSGWLVGLSDLDVEQEYVRDRIATWIVENLEAGASGIRIDAAKHISPDDLAAIFGKIKKYKGGELPDDFMAYLEVLIGGESQLLHCVYNNYQYTTYLTEQLSKEGLSEKDIMKVKLWRSWFPMEVDKCDGQEKVSFEILVIENDGHDQQNPGSTSRNKYEHGSVLVKVKNVETHRKF